MAASKAVRPGAGVGVTLDTGDMTRRVIIDCDPGVDDALALSEQVDL